MTLGAAIGHVRGRLRAVLGVAGVALVARLSTPAPPPKTAEDIAAMLGRAAGGAVAPDQFIWEPRGGALSDALFGRRVLFIASIPGPDGAPAGDLFRARVRLSRGGRAINVGDLYNLTATPLGDDRDLVARGRYVAFSTAAFGAVQGVTLLDLEGDVADREAKTRRERAQAAIESFLDTGAWRGLGRVEIAFGSPPPQVKLEMGERALVMALGDAALPAALDPATGELNTGDSNAFLAKVQRLPHPVRPFAPFAIEAAKRALGDKPTRAALEAIASMSAPLGRRSDKPASSADPQASAPGTAAVEPPPEAPTLDAASAEAWPPPPIPLQIRPGLQGEGEWTAVASPLLSKPAPADGAAAPAFVEASLRPDPARPQATVRLVAMDMRQLELRVEAGFDEPRPAAGPRGSGRLPSGAAASRVVAAFAGGRPPPPALETNVDASPPGKAPPTSPVGAAPEEVGMVVDHRILVPPKAGAFTTAVAKDGRALLGLWPFGAEAPDWIVSLRQSPLTLVASGAVAARPAGPTADQPLERSALCVTRGGHLVYAWGSGVHASSIARALVLAGCEAGGHLGGAPARSGFAFMKRRSLANGDPPWDVEPLTPAMSLPLDRLSDRSPTEIYYLVTRPEAPTSAPAADSAPWTPDAGAQPPPAWIPAVFSSSAAALGAEIKLTSFAPDRFVWRARAGSREPPRRRIPLPSALEADELSRAVAAISLGSGRRKGGAPRGLSIGGASPYPIRKGAGALIVAEKGLAIVRSDDVPADLAADAVELPLTADEGKLLPEGRRVGSRRVRSAGCLLSDGTLLIATTTFDSEEASTEVLLREGCSRVVALDRGAHPPAFVHRAGTPSPPEPRYEQTVLYAVGAPMRGRAQVFAPNEGQAPP